MIVVRRTAYCDVPECHASLEIGTQEKMGTVNEAQEVEKIREWIEKNKTDVQIDELVNPARCIICNKSAKFWVTIGTDDDYVSYYYCERHLGFAQLI